MLTYSVNCRKNTEILYSNISKTKNGRSIMQSKCAECGIEKSSFRKSKK